MAAHVLTDGSLVWNSVDLSDHVKSMEFPYNKDAVENTAMGATVHTFMAGLINSGPSAEFYQDYAASKVDATIGASISAGTTATLTMKPTSAAVSATNPSYAASAFIANYRAIGGSVGEAHMAPVTFALTGAITRTAT